MKLKLKRFYLIFLIFFFFNVNNLYSSFTNQILVKVGKEIVTSYELENKIKMIIFFSKQELNQQNINNAKRSALNLLIDTKLMLQELKKYKFDLDQTKYNNYLIKTAAQLNVKNVSEIKNLFKLNNIDYNLYLEEVKINLAWQQLIYQLFSSKISIDEEQIINELEKIINEKENIEEFELSEIEIEFSDISLKDQLVNEVINSINNIGFEKTAVQLSVAESSVNEGRIGWVNSKSLSENIQSILKTLQPGEFSTPIVIANRILFLKINNKRQISNLEKVNLEKIKKSIINSKTNQMFKMYSKNYLTKTKNFTIVKYNN
tara:strand:- start:2508 stop:3461 length:954 start_codon:yes stop_codon:yes gene_type:complete